MFSMLEIKNLNVDFVKRDNTRHILKDISFNLGKGSIIGIAGESGSGKTILAKTVMGLLPSTIHKIKGEIIFNSITLKNNMDYKNIRGRHISIITQNPMSALNPVLKIEDQITEILRTHRKNINKKKIKSSAIKLLKEAGLNNPEEILKSYPHTLSGGMNQRVMIALSLASNPEILIADEPTTALDVTTQSHILNLLNKLNDEKQLSILLISHDISLLEKICHKIIIIYAGEIMEILDTYGKTTYDVHHPYTHSLKKCIPEICISDVKTNNKYLYTIPGNIAINDKSMDNKCIFYDRCFNKIDLCEKKKPAISDSKSYKCFNPVK